ncbi:MAG: hypothetical protein Q7S55_00525 [Nanoarchaeota archaeon]|nr:hypothetical protein [Nanoarchaeota archaeon]
MANTKSMGLLGILLASCTAEVPAEIPMEEIGIAPGPPLEIVPLKTPPENCYEKNDILGYEQAMKEYQEKFNLSEEWVQWMIDHYDRYCRAFNIGNFYREEYQNTIILSLNYYNDVPVPYTELYPEEEHEKDFERLIELKFPGYDIVAEFGRDPEYSHGVVYLNAPGSSANRREIYLHYETIIGHEFGHFLGLHHHYGSIEEVGQGMNMPPGEEKCVMDRNSTQYGSSDRAALNINLEIDNAKEIDELLKKILDKYPEEF